MWQFSIFIGNHRKHKTTDIWRCANENQCVPDKTGCSCRTITRSVRLARQGCWCCACRSSSPLEWGRVRRREEWRGEILRAPTFSAKFVPKTTLHLEVLDTRREVHVGVTGEQKLSVSPLHFGVQTPNLPNHHAAESSSWPPPYWPCGFPNIARPISAVLDCYKGCHPYYSYRLYC